MKLTAELGTEANFMADIPVEMENLFMKNVLAFEHGTARSKKTTLYESLKKPAFVKENLIADNIIEECFEELIAKLMDNNIVVEFISKYDARTKYKFITEELFEHPIGDFIMPGMVSHYTYEDFHPDHRLDIETRTIDFLAQFFERNVPSETWELADQLVIPDKRVLTKSETVKKLRDFFGSYSSFTNHELAIAGIDFEFKNEMGMGCAEGALKYDAIAENGASVHFEGPFKFYLSMDLTWWSIFYFVMPGFEL